MILNLHPGMDGYDAIVDELVL
jgi:hypothetical protein